MLLEVNRYYPLLSDYIDMSDLPDFFCFVRDGLDEVFENAFCRDYYSSYSADGTTAYYSLTVMLKKRLSVGIAGTGMYLVVNPSEDGMTEFPFTLYRRWQILRVLRHFDTGSFSYSAEDFFNVALDLFGLNEVDLLRMAMDIFVVQRDGMSPFKTMEADINMLYGTDIDIDEYADDRMALLVAAVDEIEGMNAFMAVFALYIGVKGVTDPAEMMDGLRKLFSAFVPDDFETYIKELLIPEIDAQIRDLSLSLEFPRSVLRPIDPATGEVYEDEGVRSMLKFTAGSVRFSTRGGLEFEDESSFDFTESVIGNTGFTLKISDAKMDLSDRRNIAEAEAAGYPADFMGVYVGQAEIGLPPKWFRQEEGQTLGLYGERMLIGTGGFSGRIGLRAKDGGETPEGAALTCRIGGENGFETGFRSFGITLRQGMFVETDISGYIVVPQLRDAEGNAARLEMTANVDAALDMSAAATVIYDIPLRRRTLRLQADVESPLAGCMFAPAQGSSYYEIFSLDAAGRFVHFTAPHNRRGVRGDVFVEMPFARSTWRVGFSGNLRKWTANGLVFSQREMGIYFGFTRTLAAFNRKHPAPEGFVGI